MIKKEFEFKTADEFQQDVANIQRYLEEMLEKLPDGIEAQKLDFADHQQLLTSVSAKIYMTAAKECFCAGLTPVDTTVVLAAAYGQAKQDALEHVQTTIRDVLSGK